MRLNKPGLSRSTSDTGMSQSRTSTAFKDEMVITAGCVLFIGVF